METPSLVVARSVSLIQRKKATSNDTAVSYFQQADEGGHVNGMMYYAKCLGTGEGCTYDIRSAFDWFWKAYLQNNLEVFLECFKACNTFG